MTIYFMGGEMGSFIPSDGTVTEGAGSTDYHNSNFARCALEADGGYAESTEFSLASGWLHGDLSSRSYSGGSRTFYYLVDDTDTVVGRLTYNLGTNYLTFEYLDNLAAWQQVGSIYINMEGKLHDVDLTWTVNSASGSFALYVSGTKRMEATALDLAHIASIDKFRYYSSTFGPRCSQFIVADEPTIGWRLMTAYPSGAGASSAWTGTYTNIDEIAFSDADFIFSDTAGDTSTFTVTTVGSLTGYTVRAVCVSARAKKGATGPTNLQLVLRAGGTDYNSASKALDVGYGAFLNIWEDNPNTAVDWLNADISSIQVGVEAIT